MCWFLKKKNNDNNKHWFCILCTRYSAKCFAYIISFTPHNHIMRSGLLLAPFYRWQNWGWEVKWPPQVHSSLNGTTWDSNPRFSNTKSQAVKNLFDVLKKSWPLIEHKNGVFDGRLLQTHFKLNYERLWKLEQRWLRGWSLFTSCEIQSLHNWCELDQMDTQWSMRCPWKPGPPVTNTLSTDLQNQKSCKVVVPGNPHW